MKEFRESEVSTLTVGTSPSVEMSNGLVTESLTDREIVGVSNWKRVNVVTPVPAGDEVKGVVVSALESSVSLLTEAPGVVPSAVGSVSPSGTGVAYSLVDVGRHFVWLNVESLTLAVFDLEDAIEGGSGKVPPCQLLVKLLEGPLVDTRGRGKLPLCPGVGAWEAENSDVVVGKCGFWLPGKVCSKIVAG